MSSSANRAWPGATLAVHASRKAVLWSHEVQHPDRVAELGTNLVSALSACGKHALLDDLQFISLQCKGETTVVASRQGEVLVAHRWKRKHVKAGQADIDAWVAEAPMCATVRSGARDSAPPTKPGVPARIRCILQASARGDLERAERSLRELLEDQSTRQLPGPDLQLIAEAAPSLQELAGALRSILSDDITPGMRALLRLSADEKSSASLRWVARIWAARGSVRRGEGSRAILIARDACDRAKELDDAERLISDCTLAEAMVIGRNTKAALELAFATREHAERLQEASVVARTWMVEAELMVQAHDFSRALEAAVAASEADPRDPRPAVVLAQIAILQGNSDEIDHLLGQQDDAEARWLIGIAQQLRDAVLSHDEAKTLVEYAGRPASAEVLKQLKEYSDSISAPASALELLAIRLLRLGHYDTARKICGRSVARSERVDAMQWLLESMPPAGPAEAQPPHQSHSSQDARQSPQPAAANADSSFDSDSEPTETAFSGDLAEFRLPEVLEFLRVGRYDGTLLCQSPEGKGALRLSNGNIVRARAVSFSSKSQALSVETLHMELDQPRPRSKQEVERQARAAVMQLVQWEQGQFYFEPAPENAPDESALEIDSQFILLEVMRQLDEASSQQGRILS